MAGEVRFVTIIILFVILIRAQPSYKRKRRHPIYTANTFMDNNRQTEKEEEEDESSHRAGKDDETLKHKVSMFHTFNKVYSM